MGPDTLGPLCHEGGIPAPQRGGERRSICQGGRRLPCNPQTRWPRSAYVTDTGGRGRVPPGPRRAASLATLTQAVSLSPSEAKPKAPRNTQLRGRNARMGHRIREAGSSPAAPSWWKNRDSSRRGQLSGPSSGTSPAGDCAGPAESHSCGLLMPPGLSLLQGIRLTYPVKGDQNQKHISVGEVGKGAVLPRWRAAAAFGQLQASD